MSLTNKLYNPITNIVYWDEVLKIPEFQVLTKTPQNKLWHTEGSAWEHTRLVTECMLNNIKYEEGYKDYDFRTILVLSALFHDIGKGVTTVLGEDRLYHCPYHAIKGADITKDYLNNYTELSNQYKEAIVSLVKYHMQPLYILSKGKNSSKYILNLVNKLNCIDFESLLLLKYCDCGGSIPIEDSDYLETLNCVRQLFYEICSYPAATKVVIEKIGESNTCIYPVNQHPNNINIGYTAIGRLVFPVTKGYKVSLGFNSFSTSPVTKIIDKNHFETKNSLYKIKEYK